MSGSFTPAELAYLHADERRLARIATADADAQPQVTPVGMWKHNPDTDTIDVSGRTFATTRKYRNVTANPKAAFVLDDVASVDPWRPRALIVEGGAEAITEDGDALIRIAADRVISWGLDDADE